MTTKGRTLFIAAAICASAFVIQSDERALEEMFANLDVTGASSAEMQSVAGNDVMTVDTVHSQQTTVHLSAADVADQIPVSNAGSAVALVGKQIGPAPADVSDTESQRATPNTSPRDKMTGRVAALAAAGGPGIVELVVRYDQHPALFDDEYVAELGGKVTRSYETLNMRAISIPAGSLEALAVDDNVDWLSVDDEISSTSVASRIAANIPASGSANGAYAGSSVGIAVLDTGISLHADLGANIVQYSFLNGAYPTPVIENGQVTALQDSVREDLFGHGTHVAGIITGNGNDSDGNYKGSSTGATVLSLQVLDQHGAGSMSDVMAALDWLLVYGSYFDIRIVNLSLGKGISESNTTDPLVIAVENLWDAGIVVVVAAGNAGFDGGMTVSSPGNSRKVITVGSLTDAGTGSDFADDYVSSFSSMGPTIGDLVLKPDLVAPGNRVVSSISSTAELATLLPDRVIACITTNCGSVYLELSGTSMATPMVSAAVALMLDKDPTLSPATVKARLMRSARKLDANPSAAGAGLLDVDAAMSDSGSIAGEALSPLMIRDDATNGVLIEDTAVIWGDAMWGSGYLFNDGFDWAGGYTWTDENGVSATGYMWTDAEVWAKGYGWTDGGVRAKGYGWTDGVGARSLLTDDSGGGMIMNDDAPAQ